VAQTCSCSRAMAGAGIGAELLGEVAPQLGVHAQRLGLLAASVQREHEQLRHRLVEGVLRGQGPQLGLDLAVPATRQLTGQAPHQGREPELLEPGGLGRHEGPVDPGVRRAAPQRQRIAQRAHRLRDGQLGSGPDRGLEPGGVDGVGAWRELVARRVGDEHLPVAVAVGFERRRSCETWVCTTLTAEAGGVLAPQPLDDPLDGDDAARVGGQQTQQGPTALGR
jgi:hypothetical protein